MHKVVDAMPGFRDRNATFGGDRTLILFQDVYRVVSFICRLAVISPNIVDRKREAGRSLSVYQPVSTILKRHRACASCQGYVMGFQIVERYAALVAFVVLELDRNKAVVLPDPSACLTEVGPIGKDRCCIDTAVDQLACLYAITRPFRLH